MIFAIPVVILGGWLGVSALESVTEAGAGLAGGVLRAAGATAAVLLAVAVILWKTGILPAYFNLLGKSFATVAAVFGGK